MGARELDRVERRLAVLTTQKAEKPRPKRPETREEARSPVYKNGRLTIAGGKTFDCTVLDLSLNGARIQINNAEALPDLVSLKLIATGETRRARIAWRQANAAGLAFDLKHKLDFGAPRRS